MPAKHHLDELSDIFELYKRKSSAPYSFLLNDAAVLKENLEESSEILPYDGIPLELSDFFRMEPASQKLTAKLCKNFRAMFTTIRNDKSLRQTVAKNRKLRIAWSSYAARTILQNINHQNKALSWLFSHELDEVFGKVRWQSEILAPNWLISLSGNIHVDLIANYIVKQCVKQNVDVFLDKVENLYSISTIQVGYNITDGFNGLVKSLHCETKPDRIAAFFSDMARQAPQNVDSIYTDESAFICKDLCAGEGPWPALFEEPYNITTINGEKYSLQLPGAACYQMGAEMPNEGCILCFEDIMYQRDIFADPPVDVPVKKEELDLLRDSYERGRAIAHERYDIKIIRNQIERCLKEETKNKKLTHKLDRLTEENEKLKGQIANEKAKAAVIKPAAPKSDPNKEKNEEKLSKALARIESLEDENARGKAVEESLRKELTALRRELAEVTGEYNSIQQAMFQENEEQESDDNAPLEELDTSVFDGLSILCVGGHPSFLTQMKSLHPNVRFIGTRQPTEGSVVNADAVWIQSNCINHATSTPLLNLCRARHIPVRYFGYAGHIPCRRQLVQETKAMLAAGLIH